MLTLFHITNGIFLVLKRRNGDITLQLLRLHGHFTHLHLNTLRLVHHRRTMSPSPQQYPFGSPVARRPPAQVDPVRRHN